MHVTFIYKYFFKDDFWTPLNLFSPWKFYMRIHTIVSTLFWYHTTSHSINALRVKRWVGGSWANIHLTRLLTLTKSLGGVCPIVVEKTLYQLMICTLCLQFRNAFATHFSPHQFGVATKGECETMIFSIRCTLDLHLIRFFSNST